MRQIITRGLSLFIFLCIFTPWSHASINIPLDAENDPYLMGKFAYHRKLACETCPLSDAVLNADKAKALIPQLETDKQFSDVLTEEEREAVTIYLKRLFRLN
ncbi:hypothetical protein [Porticoccus sp.]